MGALGLNPCSKSGKREIWAQICSTQHLEGAGVPKQRVWCSSARSRVHLSIPSTVFMAISLTMSDRGANTSSSVPCLCSHTQSTTSREASVTSAARSVVTLVSRPPAGFACDQQSVLNLHLRSQQDTPNMPISL